VRGLPSRVAIMVMTKRMTDLNSFPISRIPSSLDLSLNDGPNWIQWDQWLPGNIPDSDNFSTLDLSDSQTSQHRGDPSWILGGANSNFFLGLDTSLSILSNLHPFSTSPAIDPGFGHSNYSPAPDQSAFPRFGNGFSASPSSSDTSNQGPHTHPSPNPYGEDLRPQLSLPITANPGNRRTMLLPPLPTLSSPLRYVQFLLSST
jgi:hypothetical protein